MKSQKLPDWIEYETEVFASDFRHSHPSARGSSEYKCNEIAYQSLHDPSLATVWERAKTYFPDISSSKGQIDLVLAISCAFQPEDEIFATEREAEEWRQTFLKKAGDLIKHLNHIPTNFEIYPSLYREIGELCFPEPEPSDTERPTAKRIVSRIAHQARSGKLISIYSDSLRTTNYSPSVHKGQVRGDKAKRIYFVRNLSRDIFDLTGQWKRETVATITSSVFNCNYSAGEVIRCTKGMETNRPIKQYPEELLRFSDNDPIPF